MFPALPSGGRDSCVWIGLDMLVALLGGGLLAEEISRAKIDPLVPGFPQQRLLVMCRNEAIGPAPLFRIGPAVDAADMDTSHVGHGLMAAAFFDYVLGNVAHDPEYCEIRNENAR